MAKIFLDCGAHCGESIVRAKKVFGEDIIIHSFDPIPYFAQQLKKLYADDPNVIIHQQGVSDVKGETKLFVSTGGSDGSSFYEEKTSGGIRKDFFLTINTINLAEFITTNFEKEDYIVLKLNVEGAEYTILPALKSSDAIEWIKLLYVAWHSNSIMGFKKIQKELVRYLRSIGLKPKKWVAPHKKHDRVILRPKDMVAVARWQEGDDVIL